MVYKLTTVINMKYLLLLCLFKFSQQMICNKNICYGKLENIYTLKKNVDTLYVMPSTFNIDTNTNMINFLKNDNKFDCGDNVTTVHNGEKPWIIPKNFNIRTSCLQRQIIQRKSRPSEDVNDIDIKSMATLTIDEGHTPCNILTITQSNISIENFDIDNTHCTKYFNISNLPKYMKSGINIYPSNRFVSNITIKNLKGRNDDDVLLHMMGISNRFPYTQSKNIRFENISNGKIMLDMICGNVESNQSFIIHSSITNNCILQTKDDKLNIIELLGPRFILYLNEKIFGFSSHIDIYCKNNKSNAINIAVVFISVTLGFVIGVCGHILVEHINQSDIHEKIEKKK